VAREVPADRAAESCWNLLDQVYADSGTPSRAMRRQEALGALLTCVSDLSDVHRQVIQMRFLDGLPVAQVAARLQKTEAAIVALTRRALTELRRLLDQRGEFTHGG
jgi:RNA polymerase sigma factor (sigma-70 family)